MRPLLPPRERQSAWKVTDQDTIAALPVDCPSVQLKGRELKRRLQEVTKFTVSKVYETDCETPQLYHEVVKPLISSLLAD
jgi:hypothetical protein